MYSRRIECIGALVSAGTLHFSATPHWENRSSCNRHTIKFTRVVYVVAYCSLIGWWSLQSHFV